MGVNMLIWLVGIIVFVILEAVTYQIVSIWFAVGAVGGLIAQALGAGFTTEMIVFFAVSIVCLLCLRPVSRKMLKSRGTKTNIDGMIGKEILITQEIDNLRGSGEGKVDGMTWTVRSSDNSQMPEGDIAVIEKVEGVKLIVKRKGE